MTIKARNRVYLSFSIIAFTLFICNFIIFHYEQITGIFSYPEVKVLHNTSNFLFAFKPVYTFAGLYFEIFYIWVVSLVVLYAFFKTQAGELGFFLLYLSSFFFDSFRFFIPLFNLTQNYSAALIFVGNFHLGAQFLAPISLLCMVLLSSEQQRQNLEQNVFIVVALCAFLAHYIPLNTAVILPTYTVPGSFVKAMRFFLIAIISISVISLLLKNYQNEVSQIMTLGFLLLSIGSVIIFNCYTMAHLISAVILLSTGTFLYLKELHYHYMWR